MIVRLEAPDKSECMIKKRKLSSNDRSGPRYDDKYDVIRFAFFQELDGGGVVDTVKVGVIHGNDNVPATKPTVQTRRRTGQNRLDENSLWKIES